jgi:hypothetical protein
MAKAAIAASLVDVRNIAAHKCVRLEIHVPAEQAGAVLEAFGWPTAVDPVPVAIARLNHVPETETHDADEFEKPRRQWSSLPATTRAAMLCDETAFLAFLKVKTKEEAADKLRRHCMVKSRSEFNTNETARMKFEMVERDFQRWREEKHF